jgi:hypothetical protein
MSKISNSLEILQYYDENFRENIYHKNLLYLHIFNSKEE